MQFVKWVQILCIIEAYEQHLMHLFMFWCTKHLRMMLMVCVHAHGQNIQLKYKFDGGMHLCNVGYKICFKIPACKAYPNVSDWCLDFVGLNGLEW